MPAELLELAKAGKSEEFEARCFDLLERGELRLPQLVGSFEQFERAGTIERLATLAQMIFENADWQAEPQAALVIARVALVAAPKDEKLRQITIDLYRAVYGGRERFDAVLAASGLAAAQPVRPALKLLDLCLTLEPGDTLISRMDGRVIEVAEIDRERGLFTLRREGRVTTRPAPEVAREYDRVAADDFRVLRQLRPEQLTRLIQEDPAAVVIGLIHAHGGQVDVDLLKHELVPKYIVTKDWPRWWTQARGELKRSPHVTIEGRAPVILSYSTDVQSVEMETWAALIAEKDPAGWIGIVEGYLREKASLKAPPDAALLQRTHDHIVAYIGAVRARRPAGALAAALVLDRLADKGLPATDQTRALAVTILREAAEPGTLVTSIEHEGLRERGLATLETARPDDWVGYALAWLPTAPAGILDRLVAGAIGAGRVDAVQSFIDAGLSEPAAYPELVFWLWKGPKNRAALRLPSDSELFQLILNTLSALGRTVAAEHGVVKTFRQRTKAALAIRDFAKLRECLQQVSEAAAITMRHQLLRLEGLGQTTQSRLLEILREVHPQLWVVKLTQLAPWEDTETIWATSVGLAKRVAERNEIVNVKMHENAKRIGEAASHGDLSENSEYKFALEERDLLRARLATINDELSRARVLEPHDVPEDYVGIGTRVTLRCVDDATAQELTFFGPFETNVEKRIYSYLAPMSQKLMGRHVGDRVTLNIDGVDVEFEVLTLASALPTRMG